MCIHIHKHTCTHIHTCAPTYIHTCISTCISTCTLTYKNTQKLRRQPIVQVFKRIKYIYSEINFDLMSHSFTLSVKWLSNANEATNGSSITMGKEQNLHRGNEDLALLIRLLLSLNLKFLKLKLEKPVIHNGSSCPLGPSCQGWHECQHYSGPEREHQIEDVSGLPTQQSGPRVHAQADPRSMLQCTGHKCPLNLLSAVSGYWAFKTNGLEDFAYMISFIWSPLLDVLTKVLGPYKP